MILQRDGLYLVHALTGQIPHALDLLTYDSTGTLRSGPAPVHSYNVNAIDMPSAAVADGRMSFAVSETATSTLEITQLCQ